ncbi:MAG: hypothetical protein RLZZ574_2159 [Cyanobacteriota bacterium]
MNTISLLSQKLMQVVSLFDVLITQMREYTERYENLETDERIRKMNHMQQIIRDIEITLNVA